MVILLLVMFLNENASRCANIRGVDQPFRGGLIMAVYRISEPVRVLHGKEMRMRQFAEYRCDCGTVFSMMCKNERKTKSCGCFRVAHGATKTPEHRTWSDMKLRCTNKNYKNYQYYGGRGITVCERWINSFENFLTDMGHRPQGCSIDRIDNNGNYEPSNCRWATRQEQQRNKRNSLFLTINGITKSVAEWSEHQGATIQKNIRNRMTLGWSAEEAVFGKGSSGTVAARGEVVVATNQERKVILNVN